MSTRGLCAHPSAAVTSGLPALAVVLLVSVCHSMQEPVPELHVSAGVTDGLAGVVFRGQPLGLSVGVVNETAKSAWLTQKTSYDAEVLQATATGKEIGEFAFVLPKELAIPLPAVTVQWFAYVDVSLMAVGEKEETTVIWADSLLSPMFEEQGVVDEATVLDANPVSARLDVGPEMTLDLPEGSYVLRAEYKWVSDSGQEWHGVGTSKPFAVKQPATQSELMTVDMKCATYYYLARQTQLAADRAAKVVAVDPAFQAGGALFILGRTSEVQGKPSEALKFYEQCLAIKQAKGFGDVSSLVESINNLKDQLGAGN